MVAVANCAFHPTVDTRNIICQKVPFTNTPPLTELEDCVCVCVQSLKPEFCVGPCGGMHIICDGRFEGYETTRSSFVASFCYFF